MKGRGVNIREIRCLPENPDAVFFLIYRTKNTSNLSAGWPVTLIHVRIGPHWAFRIVKYFCRYRTEKKDAKLSAATGRHHDEISMGFGCCVNDFLGWITHS